MVFCGKLHARVASGMKRAGQCTGTSEGAHPCLPPFRVCRVQTVFMGFVVGTLFLQEEKSSLTDAQMIMVGRFSAWLQDPWLSYNTNL